MADHGKRGTGCEQRGRSVAELIWLNYFNNTLYQKGVITENERNRMSGKIRNRRDPGAR